MRSPAYITEEMTATGWRVTIMSADPYGDNLLASIAARKAKRRADAGRLAQAEQIMAAQANDDGLWFVAQTAPEAYLQQELRRLHEAIEGKTATAVAADILLEKIAAEDAAEDAAAGR